MSRTGSDSLLTAMPASSVEIVSDASFYSLVHEMVEAEKSSEYQEILEALLRELKYRAYRRGASGITQLSVQLDPLIQPTRYRLTVSGTAVRAEAQF